MSENQLTTLYFKPKIVDPDYPRKWHIVHELDAPLCSRVKFRPHMFDVTDEVPAIEYVCQKCRAKADPDFDEANREAARQRQRELQAKYQAQQQELKAEEERKRQLESTILDTIEDFQRLSVEGQLYVQMLRTIAWIRGYKAFWVVKTFKEISGVNITINLVQQIGNEMPTQEVLDTANRLIAKYHQQKLK